MKTAADKARTVFAYHERTKHHFHRFARSSGFLDWRNQPVPFRFYENAPASPLPLPDPAENIGPTGTHEDLYLPGRHYLQEFTRKHLSDFLGLGLGLSAWKTAGSSRWALRMNPSSGNLHPTELHLILPQVEGLSPGIYHYDPYHHALECRARLPEAASSRLTDHFKTGGFLASLTAVFWRESWKYGERAFRYCQLDAGHALAALCFSARMQGWKVSPFTDIPDDALESLLGLDRTEWPEGEAEAPTLICAVHPAGTEAPFPLSPEILQDFSELEFDGIPSRLSAKPVKWEIIDAVAAASRTEVIGMPEAENADTFRHPSVFHFEQTGTPSASRLIRNRRSAVAFDPDAVMEREPFLSVLDKTLPRKDMSPFDASFRPPAVDLLLFVHRVKGLASGLYWLSRTGEDAGRLRRRFRHDFSFAPAVRDFPLFLLEKGDFRDTAASLCCRQEIAGTGVFSLGMIAEFRKILEAVPYRYRHLFWEAGMIGQVLYLEAEAFGFRGTGIGCFFDDPVHELLGLKDNAAQSLYHFTMGRPMDDPRISTLPAYHHLKPDRRIHSPSEIREDADGRSGNPNA